MKNPWLIGAGCLLALGFGMCLLSFVPQSRLEPYLKQVQQYVGRVRQDGNVSAIRTFYDKWFFLNPNDKILIHAHIEEESLSVTVSGSNGWGWEKVEQRENVTNVDLEVTASQFLMYSINIERWSPPYHIFLTPATAYVYVKTSTLETVTVQDYRNVTTYPYRDLLIPSIVPMTAGIGVGVIVIAWNISKDKP